MLIRDVNQIEESGVSHNPEIRKRVMIANGAVPHLTNFSMAVFKPGQVADEHAHDSMWEVFYVEGGEATFTIDGKAFPAKPGTCVMIEPGEKHRVENTGDGDLVLRYFGIA